MKICLLYKLLLLFSSVHVQFNWCSYLSMIFSDQIQHSHWLICHLKFLSWPPNPSDTNIFTWDQVVHMWKDSQWYFMCFKYSGLGEAGQGCHTLINWWTLVLPVHSPESSLLTKFKTPDRFCSNLLPWISFLKFLKAMWKKCV